MHAPPIVAVLSLLFFHFEICHDMPIPMENHPNVEILIIFFQLFLFLVKIIYSHVSIRMFLHCHNNCHHFLGVQSNRIVFVHHFDGNLIMSLGCSTMSRMYFDNLPYLQVHSTIVRTNVHHDTQLIVIRIQKCVKFLI